MLTLALLDCARERVFEGLLVSQPHLSFRGAPATRNLGHLDQQQFARERSWAGQDALMVDVRL